jgi:predicted deacylase
LNSQSIEKQHLEILELADGTAIRLPVMIARGAKPGPRLFVDAAVHGWEIVGTEVIRQVLREQLNLENVEGSVVAVPVANPLAFQVKGYLNPQDGVYKLQSDILRAVPGDPKRSQSQRIGAKLWNLIKESDYYINFHCIEGPSVPYIIMRGPKGPTLDKSFKMAEAFGVPITIFDPTTESIPGSFLVHPTAVNLAVSSGIPAFVVELPFPSIFMDADAVKMGTRGLLNVMKFIGMIHGEIERQDMKFTFPGRLHTQMLTADHGGIVHPVCPLGAKLAKGDPLVRILNVFGDEVDVVRSPRDSYAMSFCLFINQVVGTGDNVAMIGWEAPLR